MKVLDTTQATEVAAKLREAIPRRVLEATARGEGKREAQVRAEVARWSPQAISSEEVSRRVGDALDWFAARGDVERGAGGRYRCLPPYLIELPERGAHVRWALYGDPRAEPLLERVLRPYGGRISHRAPLLSTEDEPSQRQSSRGWERVLAVPAKHFAEAASRCASEGMSVFGLENLVNALPRISALTAPPDELLSTDAPGSGFWDSYCPTSDRSKRWEEARYWRSGDSRLVRWRPSEGWLGERDSRYFYHAGDGRVAELDADTAALWQLYLDRDAGRPRRAWRDGTGLWVPRMLPQAAHQWLMLLAAGPAQTLGGWSVLNIDHNRFRHVCETLEGTLGLLCSKGRPADDRQRGRRRGGWSR